MFTGPRRRKLRFQRASKVYLSLKCDLWAQESNRNRTRGRIRRPVKFCLKLHQGQWSWWNCVMGCCRECTKSTTIWYIISICDLWEPQFYWTRTRTEPEAVSEGWTMTFQPPPKWVDHLHIPNGPIEKDLGFPRSAKLMKSNRNRTRGPYPKADWTPCQVASREVNPILMSWETM